MRSLSLLLLLPIAAQSQTKLGRQLFADPLLSGNGKVSCSTCHDAAKGFSAGGMPNGIDGKPLPFKAPTLWNVANRKSLFWDGRQTKLEAQAIGPLLNAREMGNESVDSILARIKPKYGDLTVDDLVSAISSYERTIRRDGGRVARYMAGDTERDILTTSERRGASLFFGKANCYKCHSGPDFTDDRFHNTGVEPTAEGRAAVSKNRQDIGKFKTPTLHGISQTSPYMHNGSLRTLDEVIRFYDDGGKANDRLDSEIFQLNLRQRDRDDLLAFLKAL